MLLLVSSAFAASLIEDYSNNFDSYTTSSFDGTDGWESGYYWDNWSTYVGGTVYARTDYDSGTWGSGEAADNHLVYTGQSWSDFTLDASLYSTDDDTLGLVFRYTDSDNFYLVFFTRGGSYPSASTGSHASGLNGAKLYKVVGGVGTELDNSSSTYTQSTTHDVRVECDGSDITVWFDTNHDGTFGSGEEILTATDSTFSSGEVGFYSFDNGSGTSGGSAFDDIVVWLPDSDDDGVADEDDNCVADANADQADLDLDGLGDACDDDADGDGYDSTAAGGTDCDDAAPTAHPGGTETCATAADDDCDGDTNDEGATGCSTFWFDGDGDGYGDTDSACLCMGEDSYTGTADGDCDDADATLSPGAAETCDGVDEDCDGTVDDDAVDQGTWYADSDGDAFGDEASVMFACDEPVGFVADGGDCDDSDRAINPVANELCGGADENCDGAFDVGAVDPATWYADEDGDTFGDASDTSLSCDAPAGYVADGTDCAGADATINPGADEHCDGVDEDCSGVPDDDPVDGYTYYADADGDGFGEPGTTVLACAPGDGWVDDPRDCDDGNDEVYPGAPELADVLDNDCDGFADEGIDTDGDGLEDYDERETYATDPYDDDTDTDGLSDGDEVHLYGTDPLLYDTDGGGASDGAEVLIDHTNALDPADDVLLDSDGDGLTDADESVLGTNPNDPDSDDGGVNDGDEIAAGTDPLDGSDDLPDENPGARTGGFWGGAACDSTGGVPAWIPLFAAGLLIRRRRA